MRWISDARKAVAVMMALVGAVSSASESLDAVVETTSGTSVHLSTLWKKPAVVFYEDKESTSLNQRVKDELFKRGKEHDLLTSVEVVAIANVQGFDWFPARNFVLAAVKKTEKEFKVPVYCDFKGALAKAPWNLEKTGATTLLISRSGEVVWKATGQLSDAQMEALFSSLEQQLPR